MLAAKEAYSAALREIDQVVAEGKDELVLSGDEFHPLRTIPPEILDLTWLTSLDISDTQIVDISDVRFLTELNDLRLETSKVLDLRPIVNLENLGANTFRGLNYKNTPATHLDAKLAELAKIDAPFERANATRQYLRSLPPWPEPYTPAATPDGTPPKPIGGVPERQKITTAKKQIQHLMQNATVTRVTAQTFATQIEDALRDVPATHGNELAEPLQTMLEFASVLRALAPKNTPPTDPLERAHLELRISQLEQIVGRLTRQLADETKAREAAEALAKKDGFWSKYKHGAGLAAGGATVSIATVGVPTAAIYFLGAEHPLVSAFLTVLGRVPK